MVDLVTTKGNSQDFYWIKYIKNRIKQNKNFMCLITGQTGSGKSWSGLKICELLNDDFNIQRVVFKGKDLMMLINSGDFDNRKGVEGVRTGAGGQIVGGGFTGREPARPVSPVRSVPGFTSGGGVTPTRGLGGGSSGGGGGGGGGVGVPAVSQQVQATRQQAQLAREIRTEAARTGVSPQIAAARRRAGTAETTRREALALGSDISTPARQLSFERQLAGSRVRTTGRAIITRDEGGIESVIIPTQLGEVSLKRPKKKQK